MAPPRLSDEQKALSRQRRRDRRRELQRLRRADPEYRLAERTRNTRARREQRNDPEYRQKERERDTRAHRERRSRLGAAIRSVASCRINVDSENMAPDQVGPDEDKGVTALSICGPTMNTTVFVTVPASPFPVREELQSSENVCVGGGDKDKDNSTDDNEDDDLTSLSWLQNKNLLKGVHELPKTDYADDASSDSRSSSGQSISPVRCWPAIAGLPNNNNNNNNNNQHLNNNNSIKTSSLRSSSYDPKVHTESKPPYSFSCLIFMAIEDSPIKALPVKDIYGWIVDHFPYYKNAPTGWKNSVRHNLSLNKCFRKVEKAPNLGKGSLWMVEPSYRPCLIQALQKTPYTKGYSKKSTVNTSPVGRSEAVKDERSEDEMSTVSDVDAATAMLVLKHGPHVRIVHDRDWQLTQTKPDTDPGLAELYPIVTICPSEDHTYDNCFKMDSLCSEDAEERRRIVEGADALLNLAGITTRRLRKRSSSVECIDAKRECTETTLRQMYLKRQTDNNNEHTSVIIEHHKDKFR